MLRRAVFAFAVFLCSALVFGQCDSLRMRLLGSWDCPTDDLSGKGEIYIGKIGNYIILGKHTCAYAQSDSIWILDVSDPTLPELSTIYVDTAFSDTIAMVRWLITHEVGSDSDYIYAGFIRGRDYFRVLGFHATNPLPLHPWAS